MKGIIKLYFFDVGNNRGFRVSLSVLFFDVFVILALFVFISFEVFFLCGNVIY